MFRGLLLIAVAASCVCLAAGCGSSDSGSTTTGASATETWAGGVCSSITTWQAAITSAATSLKSDPSKNGLQTAAADAKSATETLASDLKGLGKPDTPAGQQAKDDARPALDGPQPGRQHDRGGRPGCLRRERCAQRRLDGDRHARDDGNADQEDVYGPPGTRRKRRVEGRVRELELLRLADQRFLTPTREVARLVRRQSTGTTRCVTAPRIGVTLRSPGTMGRTVPSRTEL